MNIMLQHIGVALGFLQTAVPVTGVPIAAGIAQEIVNTCQEVIQQKGLAKSLGEKSITLANALQDESSGLEGTALQARIDEVVEVLKKTLKCTRKWRNQNVITQWFRRVDMAREIEHCHQNLDNAIKEFELRNQIAIQREQKDAREENLGLHIDNREILLKIFESQVEMQRIVTLHQAGGPAARDLMKNGQEMLKEIRLELQGSMQVVVTSVEHSGSGPSSAPSSSSTPNMQVSAQQYREVQRGLAMLHRMTAILPPNKILDGEVRRVDNLAIAGGSSSDIWRGLWLEAEKVALKGMRNIRIDDEGAQKRFVREIEVWSRLNNQHILQFYGIATDLGPHIHIVSPWLENGGVLEYTKKHPDTDKMHLIRGAAEGLMYLHSESVIHGNIKCSNILVSETGEACISDFGMAKVLEDVTKTPASTTLARSGGTRWLAPEVVEGEPPSKESDTYSFGMTVLELITGKSPFPEYKTDAAVIRGLMSGAKPRRPSEPADRRWLTDSLWVLIERCLAAADVRPTMQDVVAQLGNL